MLNNISDVLTAISAIDLAAASICEALARHAEAEPDHGKRAAMLRIRQVMLDAHHNLTQARQQFQASARHAAAQGLHEVGDELKTVLADARGDDPNAGVIGDVIGKIGKIKTAVAR
jgi:hypothetical protein